MQRARKQTGFTIVELLIVVVVIAILAAITIVAYNGIQQNTRYSIMKSDIATMNKAILMYHSERGHYPYVGTAGGNRTGSTVSIPDIAQYMPVAPTIPNDGIGGYYAYIWSAYGTEYKIVRLVGGGTPLPSVEQSATNMDTARPNRGWGIWSAGGAAL